MITDVMKVVIAGGGPAGLITGLKLLEKGISPIILERKAEITSTACAEGCDIASLKQIPFDSSPYISKDVEGTKFLFPGGYSFSSSRKGVVLDRNRWIKGMAEEFAGRGGIIKTGAGVISIDEGMAILKNGERMAYDVLIGADGPFSVVGKYLGNKQEVLPAVQYKIECDTSEIDYMKLYFDKRFSPHYSWVFPKDRVLNVGLAGKFSQLDNFVKFLGLDGKIIKKEAGAIPVSGLAHIIAGRNIALIGDAASMTNPFSGGGLTPIIHASSILSENIDNLKNYEQEIKKHPMSDPVLVKAKNLLMELTNRELEKMGKLVDGRSYEEMRFSDILRAAFHPMLIPKMLAFGKAIVISMKWGW